MKYRYIYQPNGEVIDASDYPTPINQGVMVMPDIQPYKSMIDGSIISSRSRHREHLRDNGMIEIGNETKYLKTQREDPKGLKDTLIRVVNEKLKRR